MRELKDFANAALRSTIRLFQERNTGVALLLTVTRLATPARPVGRDLPSGLVAMAFRATRLLRMRIDGSHQGNQMFGAPVSKTAYLDGSGPTFSAKKYVQPAPLRKLRPRSMPRHSLCAQGQ